MLIQLPAICKASAVSYIQRKNVLSLVFLLILTENCLYTHIVKFDQLLSNKIKWNLFFFLLLSITERF